MSLNKVMLIGNVGKEPTIRYVENGVCYASFPLATTIRGYTLENGTQIPDKAEWHNIVLWRKLAQVVEKYVHKGDKLYIEGELRTRSYDDRKGQTRYITEIWAKDMEMLSPKGHGASTATTTEATNTTQNATPQVSEDDPPF